MEYKIMHLELLCKIDGEWDYCECPFSTNGSGHCDARCPHFDYRKDMEPTDEAIMIVNDEKIYHVRKDTLTLTCGSETREINLGE